MHEKNFVFKLIINDTLEYTFYKCRKCGTRYFICGDFEYFLLYNNPAYKPLALAIEEWVAHLTMFIDREEIYLPLYIQKLHELGVKMQATVKFEYGAVLNLVFAWPICIFYCIMNENR